MYEGMGFAVRRGQGLGPKLHKYLNINIYPYIYTRYISQEGPLVPGPQGPREAHKGPTRKC